ncbi:hypothetical protein GCM10010406_55290 [Streptomyces thermolineatus]|uniref:Nudix hydrolase domain-containing protein n=1 Tax=Streptomyces thermolineatus TaxID=44033 RepID=A0ABN3N4W1_9ACTN
MNAPARTVLLDSLVRSAAADGITKHVVGAVIADDAGRVLLLHRAAGDYLGGLWELPSGGVEPGESLTEALRREVEEETGLTAISVGDYLGHFDYLSGSGRKTRQFNFAVTVAGSAVRLAEHDAHEWADAAGQGKVSDAVRAVLGAWRGRTA